MLLRTAPAAPRALQRVNCCRSFELLSSTGFKRTQPKSQGKDKASVGERDTLRGKDLRHACERERGTEGRDERKLQRQKALGIWGLCCCVATPATIWSYCCRWTNTGLEQSSDSIQGTVGKLWTDHHRMRESEPESGDNNCSTARPQLALQAGSVFYIFVLVYMLIDVYCYFAYFTGSSN